MKTVKIGGVPEHFNLAWYLTLKSGDYKAQGINLRWQDYHGGTGAMTEALRDGSIDMAVILTEGIVKDIVEGNPSQIVQCFVQSPLIWGIHVAEHSDFQTVQDLKGKRAAISRYGSGSHLMAYINAENHGWDTESDLNFEVVDDIDGAVAALTEGTADYFMWEKFMSKPLVDSQIFRRIDECPTPWPCFVIAVRKEFLDSKFTEVQTILGIINNSTQNFKSIPNIDQIISDRYKISNEDVKEWLSLTEWSQAAIDKETLDKVQNKLRQLDVIQSQKSYKDLVHTF